MRVWGLVLTGVVVAAFAGGLSLYARGPDVTLTDVRAYPLAGSTSAMVTFSIQNHGDPLYLTDARSEVAKLTVLKAPTTAGLPIIKGVTSDLSHEAGHIMLMSVTSSMNPGDALPLRVALGENQTWIDTTAIVTDLPMPRDDLVEMPGGQRPSIAVSATKTDVGWRVLLDVGGLILSESGMNAAPVPGTGHIHLYVSGTKIHRTTETDLMIGALPPGRHVIEARLYANDHRPIGVDGIPVAGAAVVDAD